jgi:hypothetical protein
MPILSGGNLVRRSQRTARFEGWLSPSAAAPTTGLPPTSVQRPITAPRRRNRGRAVVGSIVANFPATPLAGLMISPRRPRFRGRASTPGTTPPLGVLGTPLTGRMVAGRHPSRSGSVNLGRIVANFPATPLMGILLSGRHPVRRGRAWLPPFIGPPAVINFATPLTGLILRGAHAARRGKAVTPKIFLAPQPPAVLTASPIIRSARIPRRGSSVIGRFLCPPPPALPFTLFTPALVRSVRWPRRGLAWLPRIVSPFAAPIIGRYRTDPDRATAVLIATADLGYAETDPNAATPVLIGTADLGYAETDPNSATAVIVHE